ncbi:hypothetical protein M413DRAFT_20860 [Hebeloma cylindrosporum]|uniref:Chromatin target of PRMT1 protein C-terminal domain-containing protein n=1 Tax=Hebeloma cylindrosporum TaxID=76867 RepID=A0A0C3BTW9_HEBCY|nr:hypothetical protein M413DRAFT_20860 [Hebeloma cylindrosporum h7]
MDNFPEGIAPQDTMALSYDDNVAYEEQLPTEAERERAASLANRIGSSKVYLLSESSAASRVGKRKHNDGEEEVDDKMDEDEELNENLSYRSNAILFHGSPFAHLPTARIFAYATHFDARPMGLEWVDDNTCVLVFETKKDAREAFSRLQKTALEEPDMDEFITARPFPIALWPPEERINTMFGKGEVLKGSIRMRWAKREDVKKKGAKNQSQFYKKHGTSAGKELFDGRDLPPTKRRRQDNHEDEEIVKARLDDELDQFLAEDDDEGEKKDSVEEVDELPSFSSFKNATLLERTSLLRLHPADELPDLASRLTAPLPRRSRERRGRNGLTDRIQPAKAEKLEWGPDPDRRRRSVRDGRDRDHDDRINGSTNGHDGRRSRRGERPPRTGERPRKTQQELDDELDAFLRPGTIA